MDMYVIEMGSGFAVFDPEHGHVVATYGLRELADAKCARLNSPNTDFVLTMEPERSFADVMQDVFR
jgi:hypothetical protein